MGAEKLVVDYSTEIGYYYINCSYPQAGGILWRLRAVCGLSGARRKPGAQPGGAIQKREEKAVAEGDIPSAAEEKAETRTTIPEKSPRRRSAAPVQSPDGEKVDRRVRKTKRQLREALTTLLLRKSFSEITVREVSELADVNRGTFYTHYRDTADLLHQLETAFLDRLREIKVNVRRQDWEGATYEYLEEVLTLCRDNADIYTALVRNNSDPEFQERFVTILRNQYLRSFLEHVCRTDERVKDMYCVYIVQGMLAIVAMWLDTGMKETPAQMAKLGGDFIMRGAKGLR